MPEEVKAQRLDLDHEALRIAHWLTTGSGSQSNQSDASHTAPTVVINGPSTKMYFAPPTWTGTVNHTQQTYSPVRSRAVVRVVLIVFLIALLCMRSDH